MYKSRLLHWNRLQNIRNFIISQGVNPESVRVVNKFTDSDGKKWARLSVDKEIDLYRIQVADKLFAKG